MQSLNGRFKIFRCKKVLYWNKFYVRGVTYALILFLLRRTVCFFEHVLQDAKAENLSVNHVATLAHVSENQIKGTFLSRDSQKQCRIISDIFRLGFVKIGNEIDARCMVREAASCQTNASSAPRNDNIELTLSCATSSLSRARQFSFPSESFL